ncbi:MAG: pyridoxal-phosphate dependent enzyme, partial [Marmoricola sp.]
MTSAHEAVPQVSLADVRAAQQLLEGVAVVTPMVESRWLSERLGGLVQLNCENLQRTGSFKIRGAYNRMYHLTEDER